MTSGAPGSATIGKGGDLRRRVLSALVLGAVTLLATFFGGFVFRLFATVLAALVFREWTAMCPAATRVQGVLARVALGAALGVMLAGVSAPFTFMVLGLAFLAILLLSVRSGGVWTAWGIV